MSFLESIQHGLEKASKEAARITKIQHLHSVATDLNFKASQESQNLAGKTMETYRNGLLTQGELVAICQQIATYQDQLREIQEEIQKLQTSGEEEQQEVSPEANYPPPPPQNYAPGTVPPAYPPYPASPAGYPAYAAPVTTPGGYPPYQTPPTAPQTGYSPYPGSYVQPVYPPSNEPPTKPGAPVQEATVDEPPTSPGAPVQEATAGEPPTKPGAPVQETTADEPPTSPGAPVQAVVQAEEPAKPAKHRASHKASESKALESSEPEAAAAPGSYAQGVLPPIFSPFVNQPAAAEASTPPAESEKPAKAHHRAKKAEADATEPAEQA